MSQINDIEVTLRAMGFKEAITSAETAIKVFDQFGKLRLKNIKASLSEVATATGISKRELKDFFATYEQAWKSAKSGGKKDLTKELNAAIAEYKNAKALFKEQLNTFSDVKPVKLTIDVDYKKIGDNDYRKELNRQISEIPDAQKRYKTEQEVLKTLHAQSKAVSAQNKDYEENARLATRLKELAIKSQVQYKTDPKNTTGQFGDAIPEKERASWDKQKNAIYENAEALQQNNKKLRDNVSATKKAEEQSQKFNKSIDTAIGKLVRYRIAFFAMRGAIEGVKSSINSFVETQYQLADLEKVINRQTDSIDQYRQASINLAKDFGGSIQEVIGSMKIWAQTGLEQEKVIEATKATMIGMNALGGTTKSITEALTAVIFTYNVAVEDATEVLSKWMSVQKDFPISAQDLANSLKAVGAAAQVVGVDLNDLAGYVAAIGSATRKSGSAVGQSLKTMFARLPRDEVVQVFENLNIAVLKNASELRDLDNILDDLAGTWGALDSVQKANLAITVGGIRRYSDFIALMDNYETKVSASIKAQQASTEAQEASAIAMATFKKEWMQTKVSIDEFSLSVGKALTGPLRGLNKTFSLLINILNKGSSTLGKIVGSFISFIAVAVGLGIAFKSIAFVGSRLSSILALLGVQFTYTSKAARDLAIAEGQLAVASTGLSVSLSSASLALSSTNAIFAAIAIVAGVAAAAWTLFSKEQSNASGAMKTFNIKANENIKKTRERIDSLEKESNLYKKVSKNIQKLANEAVDIKLGKSDKDSLSNMKELNTQMALLPKEQSKIQNALIDVHEAINLNTKSWTTLKNAVEDYNSTIDINISKLKKQSEASIQAYIKGAEVRKSELQRFRDEINQYSNSKKESEKIFGINPDSFKKKAKEMTEWYVKHKKRTDKEMSDPSAVNTVFGSFEERSLFYKDKFEKLIKDQKQNILNVAKNLQGLKGVLSNEAQKAVEIDEDALDSAFDDAVRLFQRKMLDSESKDNPISFMDKAADDLLEKIDEINHNFTQRSMDLSLAGVTEEIYDITEALEELNSKGPTDDDFFIGPKLGAEIIAISDKMKKSILDLGYTADSFQINASKLDFGKLLNIDDFKGDEAKKTIEDLSRALLDSKTGAKNARDMMKELNTLKEILKSPGSGYKEGEGFAEGIEEKYVSLQALEKNVRGALVAVALGSEKPLVALIQRYKELEAEANAFDKLAKDPQVIKALQEQLIELARKNKYLRDAYDIELKLSALRDKTTSGVYDSQIKALEYFKNKRTEVFSLEKDSIEAQRKANELIAQAYRGQERQTKSLKAQEQYHKDIVSLLTKERDFNIDRVMKEAAEDALILRDALSGAFVNIPDTILEGAEKRKDLEKEITEAEKELFKVRKGSDKQAILDAQYRLDVVKNEMKEYQKGWFEIKKLMTDLLGNISSAFWKKLSDNVAQNLSDITIKGKSIGDTVGDAIFVSTTNFINGWKTTVSEINDIYFTKLENALDNHVASLEGIMGITPSSPSSLGSPEDFGSWDVDANPENYSNDISIDLNSSDSQTQALLAEIKVLQAKIDAFKTQAKEGDYSNVDGLTNTQQVIRSSLTMLGASLATSITGTKGPASNAGAGFGAALGSAFSVDKLAKSLGLGLMAGPLGALGGGLLGGLFGGIFDSNKDDVEKPPELEEAVNKNTEATLQNTVAMKELDKALFNAPTRFNLPTFSGGGGVTVHIHGVDANNVNDISKALEEAWNGESRSSGTRGYVPI